MTTRINPFHQLVWRTPQTLQLGIGSQNTVLEQVSPAQEKFIDALYYGVPEGKLGALARQLKLTSVQADELLEAVGPLLISATGTETAKTALGDQARASLDHRTEFAAVLERRRAKVVQVLDLDATGLTLVLALAAAGVGLIQSPDLERVTEADCATNLYPRALLGYRRFQAAKLILDSSWPGSKLQSTARISKNMARPDLVVLTSHQVTNPVEVGRWRAAEVPTIQIRYEADSLSVSPVLAGADGCLNCEVQFQQDGDPAYLAIATQLLESQLRFDDSAGRLMACGLAVHSILKFIDGAPKEAISYQVDRWPNPALRAKVWESHPACSCTVRSQLELDEAG